jgi:hypothetical protein
MMSSLVPHISPGLRDVGRLIRESHICQKRADLGHHQHSIRDVGHQPLLCLERARLQPRRNRPSTTAALVAEGLRSAHANPAHEVGGIHQPTAAAVGECQNRTPERQRRDTLPRTEPTTRLETHDGAISQIVEAIKRLMQPARSTVRQVGFQPGEPKKPQSLKAAAPK